MEERPLRKRMVYEPKGVPVINDDMAFVENKCSDHARKIFTEVENIQIELWFDKHYHDRHQHGDDSGKREGIDPEVVESLVRRSIKHLLFYSSIVKGFSFINLNFKAGKDLPVRVVLQESLGDSTLNVVIEAHYIDISIYEITVKTAMCADDFRIVSGQYCIEIQGGGSTLCRSDNKKIVEICSI